MDWTWGEGRGKAQVKDDAQMLGLGNGIATGSSPREGPQEKEQIQVEEMMSWVEFVVLVGCPWEGI